VRFQETALPGVVVLEQEHARDDRGSFARFFCIEEYVAHGMDPRVAQGSVSYNSHRGTLRGLHFQAAPHMETKTVRCIKGAAFDVVADLRQDSPTRLRWVAVELRADVGNAVYIPAGCAHGFMTLEDDTWLEYLIHPAYVASAARGVRFDSPELNIKWPLPPIVVSDRDRQLPEP
jgi:dTDP-4-dehydrorhamnose 3,5-epimerase